MSWKKYGGTSHFDSLYAMKNYSVTTDYFSLLNAYVGTFTISGILHVTEQTYIDASLTIGGDISLNGNLFVNQNTIIDGSLGILGNVDISKNVYVGQNVMVQGTSNLIGDVSANGKLVLGDYLYLDLSHTNYLYSGAGKPNSIAGVNTGVGLNTHTGLRAALTISSEFVSGLIVYSGTSDASNIMTLNNTGNGIAAVSTASGSYFNLFQGYPSALQSSATIAYIHNGVLQFDCSNEIHLNSNTCIGPPILGTDPNRGRYKRVNNESLVVYDTFDMSYLYYNYLNPLVSQGNAISAITSDANSLAFMNFTTSGELGGAIGGGAYPANPNYGMLSLGITTVSGYVPHHTIVTGHYPNRLRNVMGVNTYTPSMEYIMDINGPVNIQNGECFVDASFSIFPSYISPRQSAFYKSNTNYGYCLCDPSQNSLNSYTLPILTTNNTNGIYWNMSQISSTNFTPTSTTGCCISIYSPSIAFVGTSDGFVLYTQDRGNTWNTVNTGSTGISINSIHASYLNNSTIRVFACIYTTSTPHYTNQYFDIASNFSTNTSFTAYDSTLGITANNTVYSCIDGADYNASLGWNWLAITNQTITTATIIFYHFKTDFSSQVSYSLFLGNLGIGQICSNIYVLNDSYPYAITSNGICGFVFTFNNQTNSITSYGLFSKNFQYIRVIDSTNILIGVNGGTPLYSTDGGYTLKSINTPILNSNGMATNVLNGLRDMIPYDKNNLISFNYTNNQCIVYYCYLPQIFNFGQNTVLNITGNANQFGVIHQW
jgi:hypothetical protein